MFDDEGGNTVPGLAEFFGYCAPGCFMCLCDSLVWLGWSVVSYLFSVIPRVENLSSRRHSVVGEPLIPRDHRLQAQGGLGKVFRSMTLWPEA